MKWEGQQDVFEQGDTYRVVRGIFCRTFKRTTNNNLIDA